MVIGVQISRNFIFGGIVLVQFLLGGTILENNLIWGYASTKRFRTADVRYLLLFLIDIEQLI
jgi:hypothetical protein